MHTKFWSENLKGNYQVCGLGKMGDNIKNVINKYRGILLTTG